ncbi:hypothetical protein, partial [Paenibacillus xylanilyticus]|uniref:hypothetical protein n=1 Tax=Paenibacillus xylanilyticus TaxID=248903 RepID=UPI001C2FF674
MSISTAVFSRPKKPPIWYYPLLVDKRKKTSVKMDLILPNEGDFFMAKKGQTFRRYSLELKLEA